MVEREKFKVKVRVRKVGHFNRTSVLYIIIYNSLLLKLTFSFTFSNILINNIIERY